MQRLGPQVLLSASDLVNFHECAYLADLKREVERTGGTVVEITKYLLDPARSASKTLLALQSGTDLIYQATFLDGDLVGHADFLRKVPRPSALGDYRYEVIDTKRGRKPKASYVLQLAFYGDLLARVQQLDPHAMHVVLGTREQVTFTCNEYSRYFRRLLGLFTQAVTDRATAGTLKNSLTFQLKRPKQARTKDADDPTSALNERRPTATVSPSRHQSLETA